MSSVIFSGAVLRALKSAIRLNDQATIWSGSADPTVTPTFGRQGDLYIKFGSSPAFYQKVTADGSDTNWTQGAPLAANVVDGANIRLDNDQTLRARNAANDGDVDILKVNTSDRILFSSLPQVASDPSAGNDLARLSYISTQLGLKISSTEKGANNGVATLDAGGKVPVSQLPASVMTYEGTWNASTNSPTLADGTGSAGQIYLVDTAGTQNLGSGNITFAIGDWAVHNGTIWQKSLNSNAVVSVNSQTGAVVLVTDDIAEDGIPTNLWFTDERAQDAVGGIVANTTTINLSYADGTPSISGVVNADSLTNTHINSAAAIAYSKLNLATSIVNGDIAVAAAIAVNKLAALTASKAVATDSSGFLVAASTTAAELDFVSGVTSAIQTQLNGKQATGNYITALTGDVTASGPGSVAATIAANAVTNAKLAQVATSTIKGRVSALTGDVEDLSVAQVKTLLDLAGTNSGDVTLGAVGSSPNGNGASLSTQVLTLQPADGTNPGVLTAGAQTIGGAKTFSSTIAASNFSGSSSGTNTGDQTITLTGDVTGSGTGSFATSIAASIVTGKVITGFVSGAGTVADTDTILQAINKLDGNIAGKEPTITVLTMAKGGTNKNMTASAGAVAYSDADSLELTAVGTSGQVLQSNGTSAPSWISLLPTIFGSRGTPRSIVAATGITSGASHMSTTAISQDIYVEGSATGDSIAATITAGSNDGQRMTIIGRSNTNTVTLDSTTTNVALNGPVTLGAGDVINLRFDGTNWHEMNRS